MRSQRVVSVDRVVNDGAAYGCGPFDEWIDRTCKAQLKRGAIFLRAHHSSTIKYKAAGTALSTGGSCTAAPSCKRVAALQ